MKGNKAIIIKKVKKVHGGGHHGGAWKVAYADFVTAMMAFFLLLWLLNMSSDEKRVRLSYYFKNFSIYTEGGTSFMGKSSEIFNEPGESSEKVFRDPQGEDAANVETIQTKLKTGLSGELANGAGSEHVILDASKEGLRIQIVDREGSPMFHSGKSQLTTKGQKVMKLVGSKIRNLPNKVSIEGHTDSVPFEKKDYSNWELSSDRALTARRVLQLAGLEPKRVTHVAGFADNSLLVKDDPDDPSNRRISIILHMMPQKEKDKDIDPMPPKYTVENPTARDIHLSTLVTEEEILTPATEEELPEVLDIEEAANSKQVIDTEWVPVINDPDKKPVIDKAWSPVIEREDVIPSAGSSPSDNNESEAAEQEIIVDNIEDIKRLPSMKLYGTPSSKRGAGVVQDLMSPVIGGSGPQ